MRRRGSSSSSSIDKLKAYQVLALRGLEALAACYIAVQPHTLTNDEFFNLVVPEHLRDVALLAPKLGIEKSPYIKMMYRGYEIHVRIAHPWFVYDMTVTVPPVSTCPECIKLEEWFEWRLRVGRELGEIKGLINYLCARSDSIYPVLSLFPSMSYLLRLGGEQALSPPKGPVPSVPAIDPEVRAACRRGYELITRLSMLPKTTEDQEIMLRLVWSARQPLGTLPWGDDNYGV